MFSLYGIRNIGNSLEQWKREFDTIYNLISSDKRNKFPQKFVQFLGFTIYNAKKYSGGKNEYDLAQAHYSYVQQIPDVIKAYIKEPNRISLTNEQLKTPIGKSAVIHSHNTFPSVSQGLNCPMWQVPDVYSRLLKTNRQFLEEKQIDVNNASFGRFKDTRKAYIDFANSLLERVNNLPK
jgi:hypothetical protein